QGVLAWARASLLTESGRATLGRNAYAVTASAPRGQGCRRDEGQGLLIVDAVVLGRRNGLPKPRRYDGRKQGVEEGWCVGGRLVHLERGTPGQVHRGPKGCALAEGRHFVLLEVTKRRV